MGHCLVLINDARPRCFTKGHMLHCDQRTHYSYYCTLDPPLYPARSCPRQSEWICLRLPGPASGHNLKSGDNKRRVNPSS